MIYAHSMENALFIFIIGMHIIKFGRPGNYAKYNIVWMKSILPR